MIDTHSHINFEEYRENFDFVLDEITSNGVEKVIIPSVEPSTFDDIINLCSKYEMLYAAIGVHPSEFQTYNDRTEKRIYELSNNEKVAAIGEIGLDYHYGADTKKEQILLLNKQLEIAQKVNLPVLIHDREAHEDCFDILRDYKPKEVIFHCFSGNPEFAKKCIDNGYYIAIGGVVTFKNAKDLKESVKTIPLERLLLETDAPYLAPVPFRGKLNTPAYLKYIAQEIANIKGIDVETVKQVTTQNARKVFQFNND